jgi:hypothetical protein
VAPDVIPFVGVINRIRVGHKRDPVTVCRPCPGFGRRSADVLGQRFADERQDRRFIVQGDLPSLAPLLFRDLDGRFADEPQPSATADPETRQIAAGSAAGRANHRRFTGRW